MKTNCILKVQYESKEMVFDLGSQVDETQNLINDLLMNGANFNTKNSKTGKVYIIPFEILRQSIIEIIPVND